MCHHADTRTVLDDDAISPHPQCKDLLRACGAKIQTSVNGSTTLAVVGTDPGTIAQARRCLFFVFFFAGIVETTFRIIMLIIGPRSFARTT